MIDAVMGWGTREEVVQAEHRSQSMVGVEWEIKVGGFVPATVLEELEGMQVSAGVGASSVRGVLPDQSALIGAINRFQSCGIDVRWIRRVGPRRDRRSLAETVVYGSVADQASLITIICRLQGLGVNLSGLRRLGSGDIPAGARPPGCGGEGVGRGYEIRVDGRIGPVVATCLPGFAIVHGGDQQQDGQDPAVTF